MRNGASVAIMVGLALMAGGCERAAPPAPVDDHASLYDNTDKLGFYWQAVPDRALSAASDRETGLLDGDVRPSLQPQPQLLWAAAKRAYSGERLRALRAVMPSASPAARAAQERLERVPGVEGSADPRMRRLAEAMPETVLFGEAQLAQVVWARGIADMLAGAPAVPGAARARAVEQVNRARGEFHAGKLRERVPTNADDGLMRRLAALTKSERDALVQFYLEEPGSLGFARLYAAFRAASDAAMTEALTQAYLESSRASAQSVATGAASR